MTENDFKLVCSSIDEEKEFLNSMSQDIWKMPELAFKEFQAHAILTSALKKYGFWVDKHYFLTTAFRAEYRSKRVKGPSIAILLEYDALPDIGHACGHNLIAEAGVAAAVAVKKVMEENEDIGGKLIILGTPAEEGGGGKLRLIELGAFENIDAALMVHPARRSVHYTTSSAIMRCSVQYIGKEAHAAAFPWEGKNALDAAVACYNSIAALRQQVKPECRIHVIITEGGVATNVIPAKAKIEISIRTATVGDMTRLRDQVEACIKGAAIMTGCTVDYSFDEENAYHNLISNVVISNLYKKYGTKLGVYFDELHFKTSYSTDMGNVSHVVPSIHPFFGIPSEAGNHTKGFTDAAGNLAAQEPTLTAAKALAMTCLALFRDSKTIEQAKEQFQEDMAKDQ